MAEYEKSIQTAGLREVADGLPPSYPDPADRRPATGGGQRRAPTRTVQPALPRQQDSRPEPLDAQTPGLRRSAGLLSLQSGWPSRAPLSLYKASAAACGRPQERRKRTRSSDRLEQRVAHPLVSAAEMNFGVDVALEQTPLHQRVMQARRSPRAVRTGRPCGRGKSLSKAVLAASWTKPRKPAQPEAAGSSESVGTGGSWDAARPARRTRRGSRASSAGAGRRSVIGSAKPSSSRSRIIERGLDKPEPPAMNSTGIRPTSSRRSARRPADADPLAHLQRFMDAGRALPAGHAAGCSAPLRRSPTAGWLARRPGCRCRRAGSG